MVVRVVGQGEVGLLGHLGKVFKMSGILQGEIGVRVAFSGLERKET